MNKLREIHQQIGLLLEGGHMFQELEEQLMSCIIFPQYNAGEKILELGCNIGRNTLVIACLIGNENCHNIVALDSSTIYTQICKRNLISRGFNDVKVLNRAISKIPLMQHSWDTMPYYDHIPDNHHYVNTIEWNELNKSYGPFTYLIVDSEGSLYYVLKDNPDFLDTIKVIIIENDFHSHDHLNYVNNAFKNANFVCSYKKGIDDFLGEKRPDFYCIWIKQENIISQLQRLGTFFDTKLPV